MFFEYIKIFSFFRNYTHTRIDIFWLKTGNDEKEKKYNNNTFLYKRKKKRVCRARPRIGQVDEWNGNPCQRAFIGSFIKRKGPHVHVQPSKRVRLPDFATTDGCTDSSWGRISIRPKIAIHIRTNTQIFPYVQLGQICIYKVLRKSRFLNYRYNILTK